MCPQFPHPASEVKPPWPPPPPGLWAQHPRPTAAGKLQPSASPRGPPPPPPAAPSAPTRATCDLGDERFRHQRHVGCEILRARLGSAALGALPRDPGGLAPPQLTSFAGPTLRRAELTSATVAGPARLPPGRPSTSGVTDSARRHFRLLRPSALRTCESPRRANSPSSVSWYMCTYMGRSFWI